MTLELVKNDQTRVINKKRSSVAFGVEWRAGSRQLKLRIFLTGGFESHGEKCLIMGSKTSNV